MGKLQQQGYSYAEQLMQDYNDPICATKIENWRNRLTKKHDVDKILCSSMDYRQAKQIVEYAKQYIFPMINDYWARMELL